MSNSKMRAGAGTLTLLLLLATGPGARPEGGPVVWSSYFGGFGWEEARALAVGTDGSVYVGGSCNVASALPAAEVNASFGEPGFWDAAVVRISPDGSRLLWKAVLGGPDLDVLIGLDVDARGIVTICGRASAGFPVTTDREHGGVQDAFVARLDPSLPAGGQLVYSTYLGGEAEEAAVDIAVSQDGVATVAGYTASRDFPVKPNALFDAHQGGTYDLFVARLDPDRDGFDAQLLYSTYLGSGGDDIDGEPDNGPSDRTSRFHNIHMAIAPDGTAIVATGSLSPGLPTTDNAFMKNHNNSGNSAVYVARLDLGAEGMEQLVYGTYLSGGVWEKPQALMGDDEGAILILGHTYSAGFPLTTEAFDRDFGGVREGFLARLHPDLGLTYSTFLGGSGDDWGSDFVPWFETQILVTCITTSTDFPVSAGAHQPQIGVGFDIALTLLDLKQASETFGKALYSTYYGGGGFDNFRCLASLSDGFLVGAGGSGSVDLGSPGAFQAGFAGDLDMFVAKFDLRVPTARFAAVPETGAAPLAVTFDASGSTTPSETGPLAFAWDFGDGANGEGQRVEHTFIEPARYVVTLTVTNNVGLKVVARRSIEVGCPSGPLGPWSEVDVGDPAFPGSARLEGDALSLCAGGLRLAGASDRFNLVRRKVECDAFTVTGRVQSAASDSNLAQVGLMVREGLGPGARHACVVVEKLAAAGASQARFVSRSKVPPGATTNPPARVALVPPAAWLRIEREGDVLKAAVSADGTTWDASSLAAVTIQGLMRAVHVGFAGMGDEPSDAEATFKPVQAAFSEIRIDERCPAGAPFRRGFVNSDAALDLADPVSVLSHLFLGGEAPGCRDAADVDDNGSLEITDPVALLGYLFLGGPPPAEPFSACGADVRPESPELGCESSGC